MFRTGPTSGLDSQGRAKFLGSHLSILSPRCSLHRRSINRNLQIVYSFGADPYAPLEKAINIINRVLTAGDSGPETSKSARTVRGRDRWVQFGAVGSSRLTAQELTPDGIDTKTIPIILQDYLSLPVEEYALLDPAWVSRLDDGTFRVCIPLQDMLGVDIRPEVCIEAKPDPSKGIVTLIGSKAALGSPSLDSMFKINMVAVLSCRQQQRPRHLPGRPVYRLRKWAARARGRTWNGSVDEDTDSEMVVVTATKAYQQEPIAQGEDDGSSSVPFPSERVYFSQDDDQAFDEGDDELESEYMCVTDMPQPTLSSPTAQQVAQPVAEPVAQPFTEAYTTSAASIAGTETSTAVLKTPESLAKTLLDCKVQVTMAVKVPGPLKVVPNALLGYAGSVLSRTVLNAVLPNFLSLLSSDFKNWAQNGERIPLATQGVDGGEERNNSTLFPRIVPDVAAGTPSLSSDRGT